MLGMNRIQQNLFIALGMAVLILAGVLVYREISRPQIIQVPETGNGWENNSEIGKKDGKQVTENKTETNEIMVYIAGQVKNPGVISLPEGSRLADALELAGGALPDADLSRVNLALKVKDEGMYYIAAIGEESPHVAENPADSNQSGQGTGKVNINTADAKQLETLTGIGPSRAAMIIEYREKNGSYKSIEEIMNVNGIGEKIFEGIKDHITVK